MTVTAERITNINAAVNDYISPDGVRVSLAAYADVPVVTRKRALSIVRDLINNSVESTPATQSGITVVTNTGNLSKVERQLGCTFDILRQTLFQRGGLPLELVLKLQVLTGVEMLSMKELDTAVKAKTNLIKEYVKQISSED